MAHFTIKQGRHFHQVPPLGTLPWVGARRIERYVTFDANCAYDSAAYNADDVNKLFGLSFGFSGVHHNSARFGWRWSQSAQCIELLAYVYNRGRKSWDEQLRYPVVAQMQPGQRVLCCINYHDSGFYTFTAWAGERDKLLGDPVAVAAPDKLPAFGLTCGFYFGGELTAPHEVSATIARV